jgi:hypothetical protein
MKPWIPAFAGMTGVMRNVMSYDLDFGNLIFEIY